MGIVSVSMSGYGDHEHKPQITQQQAELQQYVQVAQQQMVMQAVIEKISETCFKKCVAKPGTSLSSYESECASNCVRRYMDSKRLIAERLTQSAQQAQQQAGGGFL